jgi:hypothetical protein
VALSYICSEIYIKKCAVEKYMNKELINGFASGSKGGRQRGRTLS